MSLRVMLAEDHRILSNGLGSLLEQEPDIEVIGLAEDGRTAVRLARELSPDLVIMDIAMPELNGIEATRQITTESSHVRVIALSMHSDKRFIARMLKAGASGYLLKNSAFEELANAIRAVAAGQMYLSSAITGVVVEGYLRPSANKMPSLLSLLTAREREVLQLLVEDKTTKQIAQSLHISPKTVQTHRSNIFEKLHVKGVAELTKYAIREGLTSLET